MSGLNTPPHALSGSRSCSHWEYAYTCGSRGGRGERGTEKNNLENPTDFVSGLTNMHLRTVLSTARQAPGTNWRLTVLRRFTNPNTRCRDTCTGTHYLNTICNGYTFFKVDWRNCHIKCHIYYHIKGGHSQDHSADSQPICNRDTPNNNLSSLSHHLIHTV